MATANYNNYVPQVDYTVRDYASISDELKELIQYYLPAWTTRDTADFGITLLELFAYMGDIMSFYIDRSANEAFLTTASQRKSVLEIANLLNYQPAGARAAKVTLTFSNSTASQILVPAGTQVSTTTVLNSANEQIVFETDFDVYVPAATSLNPLTVGTVDTSATEGQTITTDPTQISDGLANQTYQLLQEPVIDGSISVAIDGIPYTYITNIIDAAANDPVFSTTTDEYGNTYILFGDNTAGRIPPINSEITFVYRVGSGAAGNVAAGSITKIINLTTAGLNVSQSTASFGGADQEITDSIRVNAPKKIATLNRIVTLQDYANYVTANVSGVDKANAVATSYNSVVLYCAQQGDPGTSGGAFTSAFSSLQTKVAYSLSQVTPPTTTVTILPPSYVAVDVTVNITINPKRRQSSTQTAVNTAIASLLYFVNTSFGQTIRADELRNAISMVDGVDTYSISLFNKTGSTGVADLTFAFYEIPAQGTITVIPSGGII
jgi:hypothetical protein